MKYEEFRVEIVPVEPRKFRVRIGSATRLSTDHVFEVPKGGDANDLIHRWVRDYPGDPAESLRKIATDFREVGRHLYGALFAEAARAFEDHHLIVATRQRSEENVGLRLRLLLGNVQADGIEDASAALPATSLSWELLWFPPDEDFLAPRRHLSIVRTLAAQSESQRVTIRGNPRLLVVSADPSGPNLQAIGRQESEVVLSALEQREDFWVEKLESASFEATQKAVTNGDFHILHFHGHGGYSQETKTWHLSFEKNGQEDRASAEDIARCFGTSPTLRLVVLSACRTGQLPHATTNSPLAGVAAALSAKGIPAVVAMQAPFSKSAGLLFAREFYDSIRENEPIEAALADARVALYRSGSPEWATPVLYLRGERSDLFELNLPLSEDDMDAPLRIGIRTLVRSEKFPHLQQWALDLESRSNRLLALEEFFDGRFIRDAADWSTFVLPRLERFLRRAKNEKRPLELEIVAHPTVAFAAGYELDVKSGVPISVIQQTPKGEQAWSIEDGPVPERPLWTFEATPREAEATEDVAVVVEVSRTARTAVVAYLDKEGISVGSLVTATISGGPASAKVLGGAHACALARDLVDWLRDNTGPGRIRFHFFFAAPNGLVVFLGQLARVLGPVRLYEHDFERARHGMYEASLDLPTASEEHARRGVESTRLDPVRPSGYQQPRSPSNHVG